MPAIETSIWLALRGRVESLVLSPVHAVAWPNETFTAPQGGNPLKPLPYLKVTHLPNTTDRLMIPSSGKHRYQGILQVSVMSVLNQNAAIAAEVAGQVAAWFSADLRLTHSGRAIRITKRPDIAQGMRDDDANLWQTPVSVFYECFA